MSAWCTDVMPVDFNAENAALVAPVPPRTPKHRAGA